MAAATSTADVDVNSKTTGVANDNAATDSNHSSPPERTTFVTILHGTRRDKIEYNDTDDTLWTICEKIQDVTGIPPEQQVLLCSGRKLSPLPTCSGGAGDVPISKVVKPMSKVMVRSCGKSGGTGVQGGGRGGRGGKSSSHAHASAHGQEEKNMDINMRRLLEAERTAQQLNVRVTSITSDVDRHIQGFLDHEQTVEALKKDEMNAKQVDEDAMKLLEVLDSISFESLECNKHARSSDIDKQRAARKAIVTSVNRLLVQVDNLRGLIQQMSKDEFGEVARRRGRPS